EGNFERVCLYLKSCADYVPEPEDTEALRQALKIYQKMDKRPAALQLAIRLNDMDIVKELYDTCTDGCVRCRAGFPNPSPPIPHHLVSGSQRSSRLSFWHAKTSSSTRMTKRSRT